MDNQTEIPSVYPTEAPLYDGDSELLRITLRIYGSGFVVMMLIFCHIRRKYPLLYNVRSWSSMPGMKTKLSKNEFGFISWVWKEWQISEDDLLQECGMDAICYLRALKFGFRICLVGMVNSLWLLPIYATGEINIADAIANLTINNIPEGSHRFSATVLAAYVFFGATIWLLEKEFQWFTRRRHSYLSKFNARNYTCFVRNIPPEFRDDEKLKEFFGRVFGRENVLEVHVDLSVPGLMKRCKQRNDALEKLEHVIAEKNLLDRERTTYRHMYGQRRSFFSTGVMVPAIQAYAKDVEDLHESVQHCQSRLEKRRVNYLKKKEQKKNKSDVSFGTASMTRAVSFTFDESQHGRSMEREEERLDRNDRLAACCEQSREDESRRTESGVDCLSPDLMSCNDEESTAEVQIILNDMVGPSFKASSVSSVSSRASRRSTETNRKRDAKVFAKAMQSSSQENEDFFTFKEDGKPKNAAFVTFTRISACQAARQLVQHHTPHVMDIIEAPDPREIYWENVGWTHYQHEFGKLTVLFLSTCLLVAWTFPTVLISSLRDLDELQTVFPLLREWLQELPSLQVVLAQLAPVFLMALNVWVLPEILRVLCVKEGHVSESSLEASVFFKVSVFSIIQTFFVSTVSGTITASFSEINKDPEKMITIIAEYLPLQSAYFLQVILVSTLFAVPWELLRFTYLGQAIGASHLLGYNLTWKEKMKSKPLKMYSLEDPMEFQYRRIFSNDILYFVVLFTYGTMAPIITWFAAGCLLIMLVGYKHNYIYNYSKTPDSGGMLWLSFIRLVQYSILIGEILLFIYLIIKKATIAWPFMIPIILATLLHTFYLRQKHFWVADSLPAERCLVVDSEYQDGVRDFGEFKDQYVRPILKPTELVIDWEHGVSDRIARDERKKMKWKDRIIDYSAGLQVEDQNTVADEEDGTCGGNLMLQEEEQKMRWQDRIVNYVAAFRVDALNDDSDEESGNDQTNGFAQEQRHREPSNSFLIDPDEQHFS